MNSSILFSIENDSQSDNILYSSPIKITPETKLFKWENPLSFKNVLKMSSHFEINFFVRPHDIALQSVWISPAKLNLKEISVARIKRYSLKMDPYKRPGILIQDTDIGLITVKYSGTYRHDPKENEILANIDFDSVELQCFDYLTNELEKRRHKVTCLIKCQSTTGKPSEANNIDEFYLGRAQEIYTINEESTRFYRWLFNKEEILKRNKKKNSDDFPGILARTVNDYNWEQHLEEQTELELVRLKNRNLKALLSYRNFHDTEGTEGEGDNNNNNTEGTKGDNTRNSSSIKKIWKDFVPDNNNFKNYQSRLPVFIDCEKFTSISLCMYNFKSFPPHELVINIPLEDFKKYRVRLCKQLQEGNIHVGIIFEQPEKQIIKIKEINFVAKHYKETLVFKNENKKNKNTI